MLVSGSYDRTIRIWDATDGKELRRLDRNQHTAPITSVKWHPNGALIASTSADNTTCLWDASTGQKMRTLREHFGWVLGCSFAPDRTKLATASWDKTVRLWDPNTGELISTLRGHTKGVWACAFYPVGHTSALLATAGEDCTARLWDTRTRKAALTLTGGHSDGVYDVSWSHNGTHIITGSSDKTVTIWDPKAGKILRMLKGHSDTVKRCVFSPVQQENGISVAASAGGYSTILWNPMAPNNNMVDELRQHAPGKEVECVDIASSGKLMATGSRDGTIKVSTVPYVTKFTGAVTKVDAKASSATRWAEQSSEREDWQEAVARRKQALLAKQGDAGPKGKVQQTQILTGLDRAGEKGDGKREWKRGSMKQANTAPTEKPWQKRQREAEEARRTQVPVNRQPSDGADAPTANAHAMVAQARPGTDSPSQQPRAAKINDAQTYMSGLKARTDANAEVVKPSPKLTTPVARAPKEAPMEALMQQPVIGKKVRLRKFSIRDPVDLDAEARAKSPEEQGGDAFANY